MKEDNNDVLAMVEVQLMQAKVEEARVNTKAATARAREAEAKADTAPALARLRLRLEEARVEEAVENSKVAKSNAKTTQRRRSSDEASTWSVTSFQSEASTGTTMSISRPVTRQRKESSPVESYSRRIWSDERWEEYLDRKFFKEEWEVISNGMEKVLEAVSAQSKQYSDSFREYAVCWTLYNLVYFVDTRFAYIKEDWDIRNSIDKFYESNGVCKFLLRFCNDFRKEKKTDETDK
mmetsp:Transcript_16104/g.39664  ORF Transcript_16104/g.39664 Transcript_16104/m.39664 type:complete len:236 (+) Transcript_16104:178-885(+)